MSKHYSVIQTLNDAFGSFGLQFKEGTGSARELMADGVILIPESEVEKMFEQPPLKVVLAEAVTVVKAKSVVTHGEGNASLDAELFMKTLPVVLQRVYEWFAGVKVKKEGQGKKQ